MAQSYARQESNAVGFILLIILIVVGGFVYFAPTIVANNRKHNNKLAIFMTNLFLGWTFLGWVAALVWACTSNTAKPAPQSAAE